jgi:hypothetical protein
MQLVLESLVLIPLVHGHDRPYRHVHVHLFHPLEHQGILLHVLHLPAQLHEQQELTSSLCLAQR